MDKYLIFDINYDYRDDVTGPDGNTYTKYVGVTIELDITSMSDQEPPIDKSGYTPNQGDKLYFMPGVSVPRIKLKDLGLQYKIKTVRDIDDADIVIASDSTIDKISKGSWLYSVPVTIFKEFVEIYKDEIDELYLERVNTALEFYPYDKILCVWTNLRAFTDEDMIQFQLLNTHEDFSKISTNSRFYRDIENDYVKVFNKAVAKGMTHEACILEHVNGEDAAIIDDTMFKQLKEMLASSDSDNHVLAMEIIANSNYKQSLLYIEMLFKDHSNTMYNTHTKNHVNFKSLLSYVNKTSSMHTDLDNIVRSLVSHNCLSNDKLTVLMQTYGDEIDRHGSTDCFQVTHVRLSDEYLASLKGEYIYNLKEGIEESLEQNVVQEDPVEELETVNEETVANLEVLEAPIVAEVNQDPEIEVQETETETIEIPKTEENNESTDFEWF